MQTKSMKTSWIILSTVISVLLLAAMLFTALSPMFNSHSYVTTYAGGTVEVINNNGVKKYIINDNIRITPLSSTLVRLEEKGANGFEDRETYYILGRDQFDAPSSEYSIGDEIIVSAGNYEVHVPQDASDLNGVYVTEGEEVLYTYNGVSLPNTYLPSAYEELKGWYLSDNPRIVPGDNGYSVTDDGLELNGWDFESEAPDVYVFIPEDYLGFCEDYVTLTGKSNLVDLKNLGYWDSRWYVYDDETALQQVKDYLDKGYSIDMLVIDTNWRKGAVNQTPGMDPAVGGMGYDIDTDLFPNMSEFLEKAHELGVNIMFNDHPEPSKGTSNGLDEDEIEYRSKNLKLILSYGLDMWWYDRNWSTALNSPDQDLSVFAWGMYAFQFIENEYYEELSEEELQEYARRAIIMGNVDGCLHGNWKYASDISAHRYTIQWTGDIGADEHSLSMEIRDSIYGSIENGIPYVSSDVGGHNQAVTDDMYVRWMQYGALSTITRVHCTHEVYIGQTGRMPWLFGDTAEEVTKEYVGIKYNLMPLYYSLAGENADSGLAILRRLDIVYPQYIESSRNDEFLLGDGILIAPINEAYVKTVFDEGFFTHTVNGITKNGLLGSYYSNGNCSGSPKYTQADNEFSLNWGTSGPDGLPTDNFSIKWSGSFNVGNSDTKLSFYADDRVKVYIDGVLVVNSYDATTGENRYDTLFETEYYDAHTSHTIEIQYGEDGYNAHFYMYGIERAVKGESYCYNDREVFIPDGTWIDVWSGKEYVGPYTYTVRYPLETSPIFVKKGSLNVLAPDMSNLSEKDWSELTLDVYPASDLASTTLYEDDTVTQAYKDGKYRTTEITQELVDGKYTITINRAEGEFEGEKAFKERTWNIRLHVFEELGGIERVTINGKRATNMHYYDRDNNASPFSFSGASADSDIYEFSFEADVYEKIVIVIEFADSSALTEEVINDSYNNSRASFEVTVGKTNNYIDLDDEAYEDWAFFGNTTARKGGVDHLIGDITSDFELYDSQNAAIHADWTNGEGVSIGEYVSRGVSGQVDVNVVLKVKAGDTKYYTLYLINEYCIGKLNIRDRSGKVKTIILDDDVNGIDSGDLNNNLSGVSMRKVTIAVSADEYTEIYVRYSMHSCIKDVGAGTGSSSRVGITAIVYGDEPANDRVFKLPTLPETYVVAASLPENVNLSETNTGYAVVDWYKSNYGKTGEVYMEGGESITAVDFSSIYQFSDYKSSISWTNGENNQNCVGGTCNGYHTNSNGTIEVEFKIDKNTKMIVLYVGAWQGKAQISIYDYNDVKKGSTEFSGGSSSECRQVIIPISVNGETRIRIEIKSVDAYSGGNASLSAVQVLGKDAQ